MGDIVLEGVRVPLRVPVRLAVCDWLAVSDCDCVSVSDGDTVTVTLALGVIITSELLCVCDGV